MLNDFFFNDTATTEIYTLALHDALPILEELAQDDRATQYLGTGNFRGGARLKLRRYGLDRFFDFRGAGLDRKSTRLNSSHANISYAVFCLKKKSHPLLIAADQTLGHLVV